MHKKHLLVISVAVFVLLVPAVLYIALKKPDPTTVPAGYCLVYNSSFTLGDGPKRTTVDNGMSLSIVLVDTSNSAAQYLVDDENNPLQNTFQKVSQLVGQDTKLWNDQILLRTVKITGDGSQLLVAKKCQ
jgi:hypothetical protein